MIKLIKNRISRNKILFQSIQNLQKLILDQDQKIQNMTLAIETTTADTSKYAGNAYRTYSKAVAEIHSKSDCTSKWGCGLLGVCIEIRAAFIIGDQIEVKKEEGNSENEDMWIEEFIIANKLNSYVPMALAREFEKEGRLLIKFLWDEDYEWEKEKGKKGMVKIIPILWDDYNYTVSVDQFMVPNLIDFGNKLPSLVEDEFVYRKIGGKITEPNNPVPRIWRILPYVENADKALRDLRQINFIFAGPIPTALFENKMDAAEALASMPNNWKVGKVFFTTARDFKFVSPDPKGIEMDIKEYAQNLKLISGISGVPIHYLGQVDEMSNRATAEDTHDQLTAATATERQILIDFLNEMKNKAVNFYNMNSMMTAIEKNNFEFDVLEVSKEHWNHIEKIFMPAAEKELIARRTFLEQLPGIDVEEAEEALAEENEKEYNKENIVEAPGFEFEENLNDNSLLRRQTVLPGDKKLENLRRQNEAR